jgi:ATP-dependent DNA helicase RecG
MTATPIPRTLGLTVFGDLDVSVIRDLPPGRQPITTVAKSESRREDAYRTARKALGEGRQVYVIYPLVEESEKVDLRAATEMSLVVTLMPAGAVKVRMIGRKACVARKGASSVSV